MIIKEYFTDKELSCGCGCGMLPTEEAIKSIYALRLLYNNPIIIVSGARCEAYNRKINGSKNSLHMQGIAFDIKIPKEDELDIINMACVVGFAGIGLCDNVFMHIDRREDPAFWVY